MKYLEAPSRVSFDEDIQLLFINFIQLTKQVTQVEMSMVQYFPGFLQKHKGNFYRLYSLINLLINYGAERINQDQRVFSLLLETSMMAIRKPKDMYSS